MGKFDYAYLAHVQKTNEGSRQGVTLGDTRGKNTPRVQKKKKDAEGMRQRRDDGTLFPKTDGTVDQSIIDAMSKKCRLEIKLFCRSDTSSETTYRSV